MKKALLPTILLCVILIVASGVFICLAAFESGSSALLDEIRPYAEKAFGLYGTEAFSSYSRFGLLPMAVLMAYLGIWILIQRKPHRPILAIAVYVNLYYLFGTSLGYGEGKAFRFLESLPIPAYLVLSALLLLQACLILVLERKKTAPEAKAESQPEPAVQPSEHKVDFSTRSPRAMSHPEPPAPEPEQAPAKLIDIYENVKLQDVIDNSQEEQEETKPSYPTIFDVIAKENQILSTAKPRMTAQEIQEENRRFALEKQRILDEERALLERKSQEALEKQRQKERSEAERKAQEQRAEAERRAQEDLALLRLGQRGQMEFSAQPQSLQAAASKIAMDLERQSLEIAQRLRDNHSKAKEETYFKPLEEQNRKVLEDKASKLEPEAPSAEPEPLQPESQPFELTRSSSVESPVKPKPSLEEKSFNWDRSKDYKVPEGDASSESDLFSGVGNLRSAEGRSRTSLLSNPAYNYEYPQAYLLTKYPQPDNAQLDDLTIGKGRTIVETLEQFHIKSTLKDITKGPTVTLYEIALAPGVKISALNGLTDNLAMQLAVGSVRLITPIPGKQAIGVEVPNANRQIVGFSDMLDSLMASKAKVPMVLGKKITGEAVVADLASAPHVLIAGSTGSGKSVCVNSLICSILYTKTPKEVRLIMVDPKVVELKVYNDIPHLLTPVITEPKKAIKAMQFCLQELTRRYEALSSIGVRNIAAYNEKVQAEKLLREKLPYIVVVMDEFADLMTVAGKELETLLHRLSAMARAVGIHLVFATQRPSADVVTGLIKSNLPTKIAFAVSNQLNSRIILDASGAETLLGKGDMLFASASQRDFLRIQGSFLSDKEVEDVVNFVKQQGEPDYLDDEIFEDDEEAEDNGVDENGSPISSGSDGDIFDSALEIAFEHQSISTSYLQRRLGIGYNKAANLIEKMEKLGYVGPARGSKPREVLRFEK